MSRRRIRVCVACGLAACLCATVGEVVESGHHPLAERRPALATTLPPAPSGDHTSEEKIAAVENGRAGVEQAPPPIRVSSSVSSPFESLAGVAAPATVPWESVSIA